MECLGALWLFLWAWSFLCGFPSFVITICTLPAVYFHVLLFFCVKSSKLFKKSIQDLVDKMDSGMAFLLKMSPGLEQSICGCPVFTWGSRWAWLGNPVVTAAQMICKTKLSPAERHLATVIMGGSKQRWGALPRCFVTCSNKCIYGKGFGGRKPYFLVSGVIYMSVSALQEVSCQWKCKVPWSFNSLALLKFFEFSAN